MRNKLVKGIILIGGAVILASCADKSAKERVAAQRDAWETSLTDSVIKVEHEVDSVKNRISALRESTDKLLESFRCVENPKEVEKYYLPRGLSYPLTKSGLAARVMANEQFELVAAYQGNPFTSIRISGGKTSVSTPTVEPDQGLNYRSGNMTTISFSGREVDSLAYILREISSPVMISYINGGSKVGEIQLSEEQTKGLRLSASLASDRRETLLSEKRLTLLSHKLGVLKARVASIDTEQEKKQ